MHLIIIVKMLLYSRTNINLYHQISRQKTDNVEIRQLDAEDVKVIPYEIYAHASSVSSSEDIKFYLWPFFKRSAPNYSDRRPGGVMG